MYEGSSITNTQDMIAIECCVIAVDSSFKQVVPFCLHFLFLLSVSQQYTKNKLYFHVYKTCYDKSIEQCLAERLYSMSPQKYTYNDAELLGRKAFQLCLSHEVYSAQELLFHARNMLKRLSGDLPIVGHDIVVDDNIDAPFVTQSFAEAQAWGRLEMATGAFKLFENHAGTSIVHFKRAWRIWRAWENPKEGGDEQQVRLTRLERVRASLWLGEAWARFMSDRAESNANAVIHAALAELERLGRQDLLQETIEQQRRLPPALVGSLAFREDGQSVPFVYTVLHHPQC